MALVPITPDPGFIDVGTEYSNEGRWSEGNLVRFVDGTVRPIGGWSVRVSENIEGTVIGLYSYAIGALKVIIIATTERVYKYDGSLVDVTPDNFNAPTPGQLTPDGFGAGMFGKGLFGNHDGRDEFVFYSPTAYEYAFSMFGTTLIMSCTSDNKIYKLSKEDVKLTLCENAPMDVSWSIVSDERFVFAIAPNGNRGKVQWSDIENYTVWTPTETNRAGSLTIPDESELFAAVKWRSQIYLFSASAVYRLNYVGGVLVYGITKIINQYDAPISANSIVVTPNGIAWLNVNGVGLWDGQYRPVINQVHDYYKRNVVQGYERYTFGGYNEAYNEAWWFFVSDEPESGSQAIPGKYMVWHITSNTWSSGSLPRTAWNMSWSVGKPLLSDGAVVLSHEDCSLADSHDIGDLVPYIKNAMSDIGNGDNVVTVDRIVVDELTSNGDNLDYVIETSMWPSTDRTTSVSYSAQDGRIDSRFTARQMSITITGPTDADWSIGKLRANIKERGRR